jgi:acetate kinase
LKTLILNCGSSSLKFQLIETNNDELIAKGLVEKIGTSNSIVTYTGVKKNEVREVYEIKNHDVALQRIISYLTDRVRGVIGQVSEIEAVGHRVVHGGEKFSDSVLIDEDVVKIIQECSVFAPLHNPPNLMGIKACSELIKNIAQVAVFDTAFHQKMPAYAYLYALPYAMYEKLKIRRYGFHGTSHSFVSKRAAEILNKDYKKFKVIVCHLGNGASAAAIKNGVSIDTSMGFTPLEGLIMGTRCGDIDPAIIPYLEEKEQLSAAEINNLMNKESGLKGISKISSDMREVVEAIEEGSELHKLAFDMYCYRIKKYIGSYYAALDGVDAVVFTAGIGENSGIVRKTICEGLGCLGISIDDEKNKKNELQIGTGKTQVMVVPTNEELAIAHETNRILIEHKEKRERNG